MTVARGFATSSFYNRCDAVSDFGLKMGSCSDGLCIRDMSCFPAAFLLHQTRMIDNNLRLKPVGSFKVGPRCQAAPSGGSSSKLSGVSAL